MAGEPKEYTQEEIDQLVKDGIASEVAGLKANQAQLIKEARDAKTALRDYDGIDPKEHKALKEAAAEAERKKAAAEGDFNSLKKQLVDQHAAEMAAKDSRISKYQSAVERRAVQAELVQAITAAKGNAKMLLPYAKQFVRVRETDDDFEAFVADEKGNPLVADGQGTPMTIAQFVENNLKTEFPGAFEGTGSSGGGASKSAAGAGGSVRIIARDDKAAFLANLEGIATGKVQVAD